MDAGEGIALFGKRKIAEEYVTLSECELRANLDMVGQVACLSRPAHNFRYSPMRFLFLCGP